MVNLKMNDNHTCRIETDVRGHFKNAPDLKAFLNACSLDAQASLWAVLHSITEDAVRRINETSALTIQEEKFLRDEMFKMTLKGLTAENYEDFISELKEYS
jgi:hypothetical protein